MRVRFGEFVLDTEARELRRRDTPIALSPKAFELLCLLVSHRPKAMAKGDLQDRLWPTTFVVEKNLANLIGEVRDAIGDDPAHPRFIRTIPRFGYAFKEAVEAREETRPTGRATPAIFSVRWEDSRIELGEGEHVIGRDPDAEVFVNASGASRRHARIIVSADGAAIEDLGSKNGTFVENQRVNGRLALTDGDRIRIGSVTLTLKVASAQRTTETEA